MTSEIIPFFYIKTLIIIIIQKAYLLIFPTHWKSGLNKRNQHLKRNYFMTSNFNAFIYKQLSRAIEISLRL